MVDLGLIARTFTTMLSGKGVEGHPEDDPIAATVGPRARQGGAGCESVTVAHPAPSIGSDSHLGAGVVVFERTVITTNVHIGAHSTRRHRPQHVGSRLAARWPP